MKKRWVAPELRFAGQNIVNGAQLVFRKVQLLECMDGILNLCYAACAYKRRYDLRMPKHPRQCKLSNVLPSFTGDSL